MPRARLAARPCTGWEERGQRNLQSCYVLEQLRCHLHAAGALASTPVLSTHAPFPLPLHRTCRVSIHSNGNALPPASPASHELDIHNPDVTVFLIGAYAKYNWPYVWVSRRARFWGLAARPGWRCGEVAVRTGGPAA